MPSVFTFIPICGQVFQPKILDDVIETNLS